jgi:uncharacterized protein (DUF4415 family)
MKRLTKSERRKQIRRFDAIRDDQINTTDIPEITEEQMRKGVVGHLYRPIKRPVTMRLDADVIAWLKQGGPGYQTKAKVLHDEDMAAAILDRVLERGRFIHLDGPSGRTRHLNLEETLPENTKRLRISGIGGSEFPELVAQNFRNPQEKSKAVISQSFNLPPDG